MGKQRRISGNTRLCIPHYLTIESGRIVQYVVPGEMRLLKRHVSFTREDDGSLDSAGFISDHIIDPCIYIYI